jgi:release factor glutamine methyltransferase
MASAPGAPLATTPSNAKGRHDGHESWNNAALARNTSRAARLAGGAQVATGAVDLPGGEDRSASDTAHSAVGAGNVADGNSLTAALRAVQARGLARLDAELLLARATGLSRALLIAHGEQPLSATARQRFEAECARRLAGEPLAYIEGEKEFWSLTLRVTPAVLVPRPETELLVERCLAALPATAQRVADLGTGSGAIALALAQERPAWHIDAVDASSAALAVAQGNAQRLGLQRIRFHHGSWFAPLRGQHYDAIVSNPPYVDPADAALIALRHEPLAALAAADAGYADLLQIIATAPAHLHSGGLLLLEHGSTQAPRLAAALVARGYARVVCHPDLAGHPRVTEARWP